MRTTDDTIDRDDPFDLSRFTRAQQGIYDSVLAELRSGRKRTHWMWFIFPQIAGLGHSPMSQHYAIKSSKEARQYLKHPVLGARLLECAEAVLAVEGRSVSDIFGYPDDMKLMSSMTLFAAVEDNPNSVFVQVVEKYFQGKQDHRTLQLLESPGGQQRK
ncbi:MAG: DUF1810 domain-containing protein [Deltaproteobacteria bacterium]|nr:DUF1810 domain-containing protein [Deltaproteobacteria bacterium]